ncbi:hypothetical protein RhiirC2_783236 [Rhizophagus irregularis]|uniref:Uncharacterized protein n=1 Tax=Rhizophagus irregularis TaxID=588596 RepID=A0A2N1N197_9GLOM|nr:hypothetical protein RhiirC2_783236 [Rhizophagus irregularis]
MSDSSITNLYEGKVFSSWEICDLFMNKWNKNKVFINNIVDKHNHELNIEAIAFRKEATTQRRYLEAKYPTYSLVYSKDLYVAIQKFHLIIKSFSNDATKMSN